MIKIIDGKKRYFDMNGKEITANCKIKYCHGDKSLERIEKVYLTEENELGTDATNKLWIESGRAIPCEFGIYPLEEEETNMVIVVED